MLPDFEIIQHSFFGGHDITVIPIADVHLGAAEQMEREWMSFLDMVQKTPNVYLTLGGDLLNVSLKNSVSNIYRERYMPGEARRMMVKMLEPVKDRILCATCGNHERRALRDSDQNIVLDIMEQLGLEHLFRENMAFVKIQLGNPEHESGAKTNSKLRPTYMLMVCHGSGGGVLTGSSVNRYERFSMAVSGVDCLIFSHTHKPFVTQPGQIVVDPRNNKVTIRPFKVICATSWLNFGGYAAEKLLLPSTHCLQTLTLRGNKKEIIVTM